MDKGQIASYIRSERDGMLRAGFATILIVLLFVGFLVFVGIPMTRSDNYLNKGKLYLERQQYERAYGCFRASDGEWKNDDAQKQLSAIKDLFHATMTTSRSCN